MIYSVSIISICKILLFLSLYTLFISETLIPFASRHAVAAGSGRFDRTAAAPREEEPKVPQQMTIDRVEEPHFVQPTRAPPKSYPPTSHPAVDGRFAMFESLSTIRNRPQYANHTTDHLFLHPFYPFRRLLPSLVNRFHWRFQVRKAHTGPTASQPPAFVWASFGGSVSAGHDSPNYTVAFVERNAATLGAALGTVDHRNRALGNTKTTENLYCMPSRAGLREKGGDEVSVDAIQWEFAMNDAGTVTCDHLLWDRAIASGGAIPFHVSFSVGKHEAFCVKQEDANATVDIVPATDVADPYSPYLVQLSSAGATVDYFGGFHHEPKTALNPGRSAHCGSEAMQIEKLHTSWHPNIRGHQLLGDQLSYLWLRHALAADVTSHRFRQHGAAFGTRKRPQPSAMPPLGETQCQTRMRNYEPPGCASMWKPSSLDLESLIRSPAHMGGWHSRLAGGVGTVHRPPNFLYEKLCFGGNATAGSLTLTLPKAAVGASLIFVTPTTDCRGREATVFCGEHTDHWRDDTVSLSLNGRPVRSQPVCSACTGRKGADADCDYIFPRSAGRWWSCEMTPYIVYDGEPLAGDKVELSIRPLANVTGDICLRDVVWVHDDAETWSVPRNNAH